MRASHVRGELDALADADYAKSLQWFFKTGKGEYGEGDVFLGLKSQQVRDIAKRHREMPLAEVQKLLKSRVHEHRAAALRILVLRFEKGSSAERERVFKLYLAGTKWVNNWDLVDLSAPDIVGAYLLERDRKILYELANSCNLWERRIAIISTYAFIRNGDYPDTLKIAEILLNDRHDLVHKAVGWMLREIGNRDLEAEEKFLKRHACSMPRVMLRYAIEKFPDEKREFYLKIKKSS